MTFRNPVEALAFMRWVDSLPRTRRLTRANVVALHRAWRAVQ